RCELRSAPVGRRRVRAHACHDRAGGRLACRPPPPPPRLHPRPPAFHRARVFTLGLVLFTVASFGCGIASNAGMLIGARAVQGVGGGIMFAVSLALLANAFHGRERGTAFGIWGAT